MALGQDERALLTLVCERGQSYADIAGLLGISETQVHERARGALTTLGGADPDTEVGLTDYLLGQADPIGRADAVRHLQQNAESRELCAEIIAELKALAPRASLPTLPEPKGKRRRAATPPPSETPPPEPAPVATDRVSDAAPAAAPAPGTRDPRRTRMIAGLVGGGVILLFVILGVAGAFSGSEDTSPEAEAAEAQREVTPVTLSPQGGSGVGGEAEFGQVDEQAFVDLTLSGLNPDQGNEAVYVLWLMINENGGYPVVTLAAGQNGDVQDRYAIPAPVAQTVAGVARFVQVSESPRRELQKAISDAADAGTPIVPFTGANLASGEIPLAEGAEAQGGAEGAIPGIGGGSGGGAGAGGGGAG